MTIQELVDIAKEDEDWNDDTALSVLFVITGAIRSMSQGEPSTFDGDCSGIMSLIDNGHVQPTAESVQQFLDSIPSILAIEIPDAVILAWAEANEEETI